ncbi:MAG: ribonuclease HII [Saprospiraceae bacterium]|jgi:ribonuclease HII|nr:ribonuclease HII [Saprospiraceae bacterium]
MANFLLPFHQPDRLEAGCDEAGRGCLAGPVYAAAVILPPDFYHPLLNDSKQMTESQRETLRAVIEQNALAWAVARAEPEEIDRINILHASFLAMHRALDGLATRPEFILVDGNRFRSYRDVPHLCVVKGDGKYAAIAAASILAKTHRDEEMQRLADQFPHYDWPTNKGYPTAAHREAIRQYGLSPHHRKSFRQLPQGEQLAFF